MPGKLFFVSLRDAAICIASGRTMTLTSVLCDIPSLTRVRTTVPSGVRTIATPSVMFSMDAAIRFELAKEIGHELRCRPEIQLLRGPNLDNARPVHDTDAIGHDERF